jgi:hypothetical protein
MREAIGSTWIIYLGITFILIYVFFAGFIMNYASAYRASNYVVSEIENCQGILYNCGDSSDIMEDATEYVRKKYGYLTPDREPNTSKRINPICIQNGTGVIYRVELPVEFDVPLLGGLRWITVKAETKTIQNKTCE